eukprot:TRINITY_DN2542_c0_g4_i1.p1 TRINITY_DN2542_c0_g4~~TRINITY_DN2542_c0_g4_i1.p1  ORF type:complete len:201 (-),score=77.37 TRINITY_DN2542_c0_g4_i1:57-659(-)
MKKRSLIKSIKTIIKEFQRQEFLANKDKLIMEQEEREKKRVALEALKLPEVNPKADENQDVWTLGLLLWQMYTGKNLFEEFTFAEATVAYMTRTFPRDITEDLPEDLAEILQDCWLPNAQQRPSFAMLYDRIKALDCSPVSLRVEEEDIIELNENEKKKKGRSRFRSKTGSGKFKKLQSTPNLNRRGSTHAILSNLSKDK